MKFSWQMFWRIPLRKHPAVPWIILFVIGAFHILQDHSQYLFYGTNDGHGNTVKNASISFSKKLLVTPKMQRETPIPPERMYLIKKILLSPKIPTRQIDTIVLVKSNVELFDRRNMIRATWAQDSVMKSTKMTLIFLVALSNNSETNAAVEKEAKSFGDILEADYFENYRLLLWKMLTAFKYLTTYPINFSHLLVTDDDVFINTWKVYRALRDDGNNNLVNSNSSSIYCAVRKKVPTDRNVNSKYFIPKTEYAGSRYPPFCPGNFYVITRDLISVIYWDIISQPRKMHLDDVLMTGIALYKKRRLRWTNWSKFSRYSVTLQPTVINNLMYIHGMKPAQIKKVWIILLQYVRKQLKLN